MTIDEVEKIKTVVENKDYIVQLVNTVAKTLIEAFENLKIEDINMFQLGYNKAIDDYKSGIKEELERFEVKNLDTCVLYDLMDRKAERLKAGGENDNI